MVVKQCVWRENVCEEKTDREHFQNLLDHGIVFCFVFHVIKLVVPFRFRNTGTLYFMASMKMTWLGIVQHEWKKGKVGGEREGEEEGDTPSKKRHHSHPSQQWPMTSPFRAEKTPDQILWIHLRVKNTVILIKKLFLINISTSEIKVWIHRT